MGNTFFQHQTTSGDDNNYTPPFTISPRGVLSSNHQRVYPRTSHSLPVSPTLSLSTDNASGGLQSPPYAEHSPPSFVSSNIGGANFIPPQPSVNANLYRGGNPFNHNSYPTRRPLAKSPTRSPGNGTVVTTTTSPQPPVPTTNPSSSKLAFSVADSSPSDSLTSSPQSSVLAPPSESPPPPQGEMVNLPDPWSSPSADTEDDALLFDPRGLSLRPRRSSSTSKFSLSRSTSRSSVVGAASKDLEPVSALPPAQPTKSNVAVSSPGTSLVSNPSLRRARYFRSRNSSISNSALEEEDHDHDSGGIEDMALVTSAAHLGLEMDTERGSGRGGVARESSLSTVPDLIMSGTDSESRSSGSFGSANGVYMSGLNGSTRSLSSSRIVKPTITPLQSSAPSTKKRQQQPTIPFAVPSPALLDADRELEGARGRSRSRSPLHMHITDRSLQATIPEHPAAASPPQPHPQPHFEYPEPLVMSRAYYSSPQRMSNSPKDSSTSRSRPATEPRPFLSPSDSTFSIESATSYSRDSVIVDDDNQSLSSSYAEIPASPAVKFLSKLAGISPTDGSNLMERIKDEAGDEIEGYVLGRPIGVGGFSIVREGTKWNKETGEIIEKVAVKIIKHDDAPASLGEINMTGSLPTLPPPPRTATTARPNLPNIPAWAGGDGQPHLQPQPAPDRKPYDLAANLGKVLRESQAPTPRAMGSGNVSPNHLAYRDRSMSSPVLPLSHQPSPSVPAAPALPNAFPFPDSSNKDRPMPITSEQSKIRTFLSREISVWSRLKHSMVVPLLKLHSTPRATYIFMPLYTGNLLQYINESSERGRRSVIDPTRGRLAHANPLRGFTLPSDSHSHPPAPHDTHSLDLSQARHIFSQIVEGVQYLHLEAGIIHRDLKLENILQNEKGDFHIADFGLAELGGAPKGTSPSLTRRQSEVQVEVESSPTNWAGTAWAHPDTLKENERGFVRGGHILAASEGTAVGDTPGAEPQTWEEAAGSLAYMSPEQIRSASPLMDRSLDIWSLGCILYALIDGHLPFEDSFEPRLKIKIMKGDWELPTALRPSAINGKPQRKFWGAGPNEKEQEMEKRMAEEVLRGCLEMDISKRWDIRQVAASNWLAKEAASSRGMEFDFDDVADIPGGESSHREESNSPALTFRRRTSSSASRSRSRRSVSPSSSVPRGRSETTHNSNSDSRSRSRAERSTSRGWERVLGFVGLQTVDEGEADGPGMLWMSRGRKRARGQVSGDVGVEGGKGRGGGSGSGSGSLSRSRGRNETKKDVSRSRGN